MKNKILLLIITLLLIPTFVYAKDTCNDNDIKIKSITLKELNGSSEEVQESSINNNTINLNLKMYDVGDSSTYDITVENTSDEYYYFTKDSMKLENDYLEYSLKNNNEVIPANSTKTIELRIIYKKQIPNNNYIDTNNLSISLSDTPLENPKTNMSKNFVIILILFLLISVFLITNNKKKILLIVIVFYSFPLIVLATCNVKIEIESKIEIQKKKTIFKTLMSEENNSCMVKYNGNVTDTLRKTEPATKVYFDRCIEKRNIIFANKCWLIIRTNETGGIRMTYNGEPENGKCESTRQNHKGIIGNRPTSLAMDSPYLYSSSFTYDNNTNSFTLENPEFITWSNETYQQLLGKYTCRSTEDTCAELYNVNGYVSNKNAYTEKYTIGETNYAQVGSSSYNLEIALHSIGYMYNYTHEYKQKNMSSNEYLYGNSYEYDSETNTYTLTGDTQVIGDWENGYDKLDNTHYTCWNSTGKCKTLSYVFYTSYQNSQVSQFAIYINLNNNETVEEVLHKLYSSEDLNKYDSAIKSYIENWYMNNLLDYSSYIEDSVYCNDIGISELGGWDPNSETADASIVFRYLKNYQDLSCSNDLYQFTTTNEKAKLKYPVNLMQTNEYYYLYKGNNTETFYDLVDTGSRYLLTPGYNFVCNGGINCVSSTLWSYPAPIHVAGVRPVISLKPNTIISSGLGSESNPWIVE